MEMFIFHPKQQCNSLSGSLSPELVYSNQIFVIQSDMHDSDIFHIRSNKLRSLENILLKRIVRFLIGALVIPPFCTLLYTIRRPCSQMEF